MVYTILLTENSNSNDIVIIKACETQLLLNLHFLFLSMFFFRLPLTIMDLCLDPLIIFKTPSCLVFASDYIHVILCFIMCQEKW